MVSGGNIITSTVHHRVAGIVYPVVSGAAFEVGYVPVIGLNPKWEILRKTMLVLSL
jgi:hypothetical protein